MCQTFSLVAAGRCLYVYNVSVTSVDRGTLSLLPVVHIGQVRDFDISLTLVPSYYGDYKFKFPICSVWPVRQRYF